MNERKKRFYTTTTIRFNIKQSSVKAEKHAMADDDIEESDLQIPPHLIYRQKTQDVNWKNAWK